MTTGEAALRPFSGVTGAFSVEMAGVIVVASVHGVVWFW